MKRILTLKYNKALHILVFTLLWSREDEAKRIAGKYAWNVIMYVRGLSGRFYSHMHAGCRHRIVLPSDTGSQNTQVLRQPYPQLNHPLWRTHSHWLSDYRRGLEWFAMRFKNQIAVVFLLTKWLVLLAMISIHGYNELASVWFFYLIFLLSQFC